MHKILTSILIWLPLLGILSCSTAPPARDFSSWPATPAHHKGELQSPSSRLLFQEILDRVAKGQHLEAREMAETALSQNPNQPNLWILWAKILNDQGESQEALDMLSTNVKKNPRLPSARVARGLFLKELGYRESAREDLDWVYKKTKYRSFELLWGMTLMRLDEKQYAAAFKYVRKAIQIKDDQPGAWFLKMRLELQYNQWPAALKSGERLIALAPERADYQQFYIETLYLLRKPKEMEVHLNLMIPQFPDKPWFPSRLSILYFEQGSIPKGKGVLKKALGRMPKSEMLNFRYAAVLMAEQNSDEALKHYLAGLKSQPKNQSARLNVARILLRQGRMEEALVHLDQLFAEGTVEVSVYEALAKIYNQQGDTWQGERAIVAGLKLQPKNATLLTEYALILEKRGKGLEAITAYKKAALTTKTPGFVYGRLALLYLDQKNLKQSRHYLTQAMLISPNSPRLQGIAVDLSLEEGKLDQALFQLERMIKGSPGSYWPQARKGLILLQQNKSREALEAINQALKITEEESSLWEIQGQALEDLARYEQAELAYQKALQKNPTHALLLTKISYVQVHTAPAKAKLNLDTALNHENFDFSSLELYYSLRGQSHQVWGFKKGSREDLALQAFVRRDFKQGKKHLKKIRRSSHYPFLKFYGLYMEKRGKTKLRMSKTQKRRVKNPWHLFYLGLVELRAERMKPARSYLLKAHAKAKTNPWIMAKLAQIHEHDKEHKKAIALLKAHLEKRPDSIWAQIRLALNYDLIQEGRLSEKVYLSILKKKPNDHLVLNNLAWLYATTKDQALQNKLDDALSYSHKAVKINPSSANLDTLAEIYYLRQEYKKALKAIERALDQDRKAQDYFKKQKKKIQRAIER